MTAYHIHQGDALAVLREMPSESVDCCITSPPYYGLRDYQTGTWEGGDADCQHSVGGQVQDNKAPGAITTGVRPGVDASVCRKCGATRIDKQIGLEPTPAAYIARLVDVFREVRRVLRADGTLFVNVGDSYNAHPGQRKETDKAGAKQATSVGSVGAPSRSIPGLKPKDLIGIPWLLAFALRNDGWWLRSEIIWDKKAPMPESVKDRPTRSHEHIFLLSKAQRYYYDAEAIAEPCGGFNGSSFTSGKTHDARAHMAAVGQRKRVEPETRNKRDVWRLSPGACKEAHFATFPIELPETCLRAGCPEGGIVLDPFAGAGTTGLACLKNGRRFVGIELNADYIAIAYNRARRHYPLLVEGAA